MSTNGDRPHDPTDPTTPLPLTGDGDGDGDDVRASGSPGSSGAPGAAGAAGAPGAPGAGPGHAPGVGPGHAPGVDPGVAADPGSSGAAPRSGALDRLYAWLRGLGVTRSTGDEYIAGVCGGIAARFGIASTVVRLLAVAAVVVGGLGLPLYVLAWVLLPTDRGSLVVERALRDGDGGAVAGLVLALLVVANSLTGPVADVHPERAPWVTLQPNGMVLLALIVVAVLWYRHRAGRIPGGGPALSRAPAHPGYATTDGGWAAGSTAGGATRYEPSSGAPMTSEHAGAQPVPPTPTDHAQPVSTHRRRPRRPRLAAHGQALVAGLALAAGAVGTLEARSAHAGSPALVGLLTALAVASAAVVAVGVRGLRAGAAGTLVVALALASAGAAVPRWGAREWAARDAAATRLAPTAVTDGQVFGARSGRLVVDLGSVPRAGLRGQRVDARLGAGALRVVVPRGVPVRVLSSVDVGAWQRYGRDVVESSPRDQAVGRDSWGDEHPDAVAGGVGQQQDTLFGTTDPTTTPALVVDAHVGVGALTIEESAR